MRILLDTNIVIPLEDSSRALEPHLARLNELATANGHQLLIHPASQTDINRDQNLARRAITLSRLRRYPLLETPPRFDLAQELGALDNDGVDRELLFALEQNAVSVLVTEDRGIHTRAAPLGLAARVLYVQQAVSWLELLHSVRDVAFPNIRKFPIHNLRLEDPFFDSLRAGYQEFDTWFRRVAQTGRRAWLYAPDDGPPKAICIYNRETRPTVSDDGFQLPGEVLKLCTFKVSEEVRGRRVGELFLKAAFRYAFENQMEHVFLTMLPSQVHLRDLCGKYGFEPLGSCSRGREIVMVKKLPRVPPVDVIPPLDYHIKYSPCIKVTSSTQILLIPIQPRFHNLLFPEIGSQLQFFTDPTVGNALTLAYLCHATLRTMNAGDVVVFYRSDDLRKITTIGVIETAFRTSDVEEIVRSVAKRTVFAYPEIQQMAARPVRVIMFRLAMHLSNGPDYEELIQRGIISGPIQSIRRLSIHEFKQITQFAGLQSCLFAD